MYTLHAVGNERICALIGKLQDSVSMQYKVFTRRQDQVRFPVGKATNGHVHMKEI